MVGHAGGGVGTCRLSCKMCRQCREGDHACQDENRVLGGFLPLYHDFDGEEGDIMVGADVFRDTM